MQNITLGMRGSCRFFIGFYLVLLYVILPREAFAQDILPWAIRVDYGGSEIHRSESDGRVIAFHVSHVIEHRGALRSEQGIVGGSADQGFLYFDLGLELHPLTNFPLSPFVSAGGGLLIEPEFFGEILRVAVGAEVNSGQRIAFRFAIQRSIHGGVSGPHLVTIGVGFRFGRHKQQ